MIYLVYPLLLFALLAGCRCYKGTQWNEEFLSLGQTKAFQGFLAIVIMLHHCAQETCAAWVPDEYYTPGLGFFLDLGYVSVSFFTFCSGYGLYKSFKNKKNYLSRNFIFSRILPVIVLGYFVSLIFFVVRILLGEQMDYRQIIYYLSGMQLANPNGWFVVVIPFFYLCFFLAFRYIKKEKLALLAVILFTLAYQLLGVSIDHNDWWMKGEYWYNSIHLFPVGIFLAMYEDKIVWHIKRHYRLYCVICYIAVVLFFFLSGYARKFISYYGEYWDAPDKVQRRIICLSSEIAASSSAVFFFLFLGMRIRIGNPLLDLMGKVTLHFYLIHSLFSEMFCYAFDEMLGSLYIKNNFLYVIAVFVMGLLSALILWKLEKSVWKVIRKRNITVDS